MNTRQDISKMDVRDLTIAQIKVELVRRSDSCENDTPDYAFLFAEIVRIRGDFSFIVEKNLLVPTVAA